MMLLETIKVTDNTLQHLEYHNRRVNYSRSKIFGSKDSWDLSKLITVPELETDRIYRCRFIYSENVELIEFLPYTPRKIHRLYLVTAENLDYSFKYAKRDALEQLKKNAAAGKDTDILIVKNGMITDTSFANIAFYDGREWFTPSPPLLDGTKRAYYLQNRMITECRISPADLHKYQKARLINAMLDLEDSGDIDIKNILA